jgi:hypothetical protein
MNKNKITRFSEMNLNKETSKIGSHNESLSSVGSKIKRVVTGKSAGEEIQKLSQSQQDRLTELYRENPEDAAKYLRSIIIKEKNSQFGLGLALAIAGSGMIYKASNYEPPPPPPPVPPPVPPPPVPDPEIDLYTIKSGDSWWKVSSEHLPPGSSNKEILAYAKQLAADNGAEHLYSGKLGSPGLEPDTWTDLDTGRLVGKDVLTDADKLFPGEEIQLTPFKFKTID